MKNYEIIKGYIYKITSPNQKIYIGQTINISQRKRKYKAKFFNGQIKLWNNCIKYKWNPIDTFEIIEECLCGQNKEILNKQEVFWINFYQSDIYGLNCNKGGHGNLGIRHSEATKKKLSAKSKEHWSKMTDEQKEIRNKKLSEIGKTRKHSQETKNKISKTKLDNPQEFSKERRERISSQKKGNKNMQGKNHSQKTKEKISNSKKGIPALYLRKMVYCSNNNKIYNSMKEAAMELKINQSKISMVCNGKRQSTGGYKFKIID